MLDFNKKRKLNYLRLGSSKIIFHPKVKKKKNKNLEAV